MSESFTQQDKVFYNPHKVDTVTETAGTHLFRLTVVVKGVKVCRRSKAGVEVSCGDSRCHPLVIGEKGQQCLPPCFRVVSVGPVRVHKLDGLPEDVFALRVAVEVVNEAGHGVVKVISLYAVVVVHDELYELKALTLVDSEHDVVVEELPLRKQMVQMVVKNNKFKTISSPWGTDSPK